MSFSEHTRDGNFGH